MPARKAVITAAIPAILAIGAYQADRYLQRKLLPAGRDMPHEPIDFGLDAQEVWMESRLGTALHAWYVPPAHADGHAVVVYHGWGANASLMLPIAARLAEEGFGVLVPDGRGHGYSSPVGEISLPRFSEDLTDFVDFTASQPEVGSVAVLGHSMGAASAILVGTRRADLDAVVAVGAFADPRELMAKAPGMARLPETLQRAVFRRMEAAIGARFDEISPLFVVDRVVSPLLLVQGGKDQVIPMDDFERLREAAPPGTRSLLVEDGVHDRLDEYLPVVDDIVTFLHTTVGEGVDASA